MNNGDVLKFFDDQLTITCHHTPCHTKGHILYQLESGEAGQHDYSYEMKDEYMIVRSLDRIIFTGDTIFIGGCGRFFEGNAAGMLYAMDLMLKMPEDIKIFCGHEYTRANFDFCIKAEGATNADIGAYWDVYKAKLDNKEYTIPSVMKDEKKYNVFMRCREPSLAQIFGTDDPEKIMHALREWKNSGNKPAL